MRNVTIIGAGSFGTALATVLDTAGNNVQIWAREKEVVDSINNNHRNPSYYLTSGCRLPSKLMTT